METHNSDNIVAFPVGALPVTDIISNGKYFHKHVTIYNPDGSLNIEGRICKDDRTTGYIVVETIQGALYLLGKPECRFLFPPPKGSVYQPVRYFPPIQSLEPQVVAGTICSGFEGAYFVVTDDTSTSDMIAKVNRNAGTLLGDEI